MRRHCQVCPQQLQVACVMSTCLTMGIYDRGEPEYCQGR